MDEPDSDDYDSDEVNEAFDLAWSGLKNGSLKCLNSDGTFRCPYSPGRKKQNYIYSELHQHAAGVGKGERGPVAAGKHRALQKYLEQDMASRAHPQAERVIHLQQEVPPRVDNEDKRVRPWMGILQNIDNRTRRATDQFRIGPGAADIKEHLRAFNPESVKVLYDYKGHLGMAVVGFRNTMDGFKDAEAFEKSFDLRRRGRKDFEMNYPHACGEQLYGWMATKKDVDGYNKGSHKLLVEHLRANGDLKCLPEIVKELELTAQQQMQYLKKVVINKDDVLQVTHRENWSLINKVDLVTAQREQAESEKLKLIENHKKELEDLQRAASLAAEEHESNMAAYRTQIENRMKELESKCSELGMLKIENEAEKARNFAERQETQKLLAWYKGQAKIQEEQQLKQIELIKKHKDESDKLETELQKQRKKLQAKQWRELENHRVTEQLEAEKAKKAGIIEANIEETEKEKEEYVKKIAELEEKLKDCEEDMDANNDLVNHLTVSHRQANNEVEDAKKLILNSGVLQKYGTSEIGVKRLGELNTKGWWDSCGHKFASASKFQKWLSKIEKQMEDHMFEPIKLESDGKGGHKYSINEDDKVLTSLRDQYGPLVANAVGAAMLEMTIWNPSGRYIVSMPWDFKANQKATMSELVNLFINIIKVKENEVHETEKKLKALEMEMRPSQSTTKGLNSVPSRGRKRPRP